MIVDSGFALMKYYHIEISSPCFCILLTFVDAIVAEVVCAKTNTQTNHLILYKELIECVLSSSFNMQNFLRPAYAQGHETTRTRELIAQEINSWFFVIVSVIDYICKTKQTPNTIIL